MAQHRALKREQETVQQTAKHDVPPPLSIELPTMSDLPSGSEPWSEDRLPVDILLLTEEDCEFLACYTHMRNSVKSYSHNLGFVYFGNMGESKQMPLKVALMRCFKDSSSPGGSLNVVKNAVMRLRPKVVYCVGCCEGLKPEDTELGDVVISSKLTTEYFKTPVGKHMNKLIMHAGEGWHQPLLNPEARKVKVHRDSDILSGVDRHSAKRRRVSHSEAIASESQGEGIFAAAHDLEIEWVIVKGISHFANDSNAPDNSWKCYASVMAASLVSNMLNNPVVFQDWPHYEDMQAVQKEPSTSKRKDDKHAADSAWLEKCKEQLRTIYAENNKVKIIPWDKTSSIHIKDIYTELSWLKDDRKPSGKTQEKLKHYIEIFNSGEHIQEPKRILIYGPPGIGKTVFTQKITFDWSQQLFKEKLGTFELVLLVRLREVRDLKDVKAILRASKLLTSDGKISVDELYDYIRDHEDEVLLILDGYDEYSAGNQSPVREIWERDQLRNCCVIITTRQINADELKSGSHAQFMINGFDSKHQEEFARKFFKDCDKEDFLAFLVYLKKHDLGKVAEIPLLLLMLCLLWKETKQEELPTSRAKIYRQFIQTFLDQLFEKDAVYRKVDTYADELCKLGSLAFDALLIDCLYFPLSKLSDHDLIQKLIHVGLFHILNMSSLSRDQGVYFIHKSLQEYLAGSFLKEELLSGKAQITSPLSKIDSIEKIVTMAEVFKFACELSGEAAMAILSHLRMVAEKKGLTGYNFGELPCRSDLSQEQYNFLKLWGQFFFSCSAETRKNFFPAFLSYTQGVLLICPSQLHIIANDHLLKSISPLNFLFFTDDNSHNREQHYNDLITVVEDLNAVVVGHSAEKKASDFLRNHHSRQVKEFFVLKNEQNTYLYFDHIQGNLQHFPTEMVKELIAAPTSTTQTNRKPDNSGHCLSLVRYINVYYAENRVSEREVLPDVFPFVLAPESIWVYGEAFLEYDDQLTETLVTNINYTNRLRNLVLFNINLTAKAATFIARSLDKCRDLRTLDLSSNPLGEGLSVLTERLSCVPDLEILLLENVMMTKDQVHALAETVHKSNISKIHSYYHTDDGDTLSEEEWRSEEYWKEEFPSLFPDSSSESEDEQEQDESLSESENEQEQDESLSESENEQEQDESLSESENEQEQT